MREKVDTRRGVSIEVVPETLGNDIIEVFSTTEPGTKYRVDTIRKRCSCKSWIFARNDPKTGKKPPCLHLKAMGLI